MIRFPTDDEKDLYEKAAGRDAPWCFLVHWILFGAGGAFGPLILHRFKDRPDVIVHEMVHVHQFYDGWGIVFWVKYLWQLWRKGYRNNPYEIAARAVQARAIN